ncbi:unnamed protein product [Paramecium pentaurelia]|uniref:Uncharacterized protein n=1 Tax=Paramecium pentaurelia TaxID=43138 RepID=A0A8S1VGB0_9CILI|nr:unnamed protein product [Paramecium pentaurelia]
MKANSKSLSYSIKKDLYLQIAQLKSKLNELIDYHKTFEVVQYVEQQREWLQKLFQA